MLLEDKVAVIYGAGGAVGRAVTLAFAREGATLFLTGRHAASVEGLAREINATGESAEAEVLDALDGEGIDKHLDAVIAKAGRIDISFNAVGIRNTHLQGVPLVGLDVEEFVRPIETYARSYFLTSRLAARRMVAKRAGVIMTVTSTPSELIAARSHGKRLSTLTEMASVAAFMASDRASGMTGTVVNLSLGALDD